MQINIYLGTKCWKWTGDELQASEFFLMTSIIFLETTNFFKYINVIHHQIGNCMLINIFLETIGWKSKDDEL